MGGARCKIGRLKAEPITGRHFTKLSQKENSYREMQSFTEWLKKVFLKTINDWEIFPLNLSHSFGPEVTLVALINLQYN